MARVPGLFTPGSLMGFGVDPFTTLHREVNRLFDDALRGAPPTGAQGGASTLLSPHLDVSESDKAIRISAELPGVSENDVEVSLNEDVLTIRAEKRQERKEEREGVHISERTYGTFQRAIRLPFQVNPDQVEARFENGVLHVTLPKTTPQERSRKIQIQGGGGGQRSGATLEGNARAPSHVGTGPGSSIPTSGAGGAPSAGGEPGSSVASSVLQSGANNAPSAGGAPGSAGAGSGNSPPTPGTP